VVERSVVADALGGSVIRVVSGRDPACSTAKAGAAKLPELAKTLTGEPANINREVIHPAAPEKNELLARARRPCATRDPSTCGVFPRAAVDRAARRSPLVHRDHGLHLW